MASEAASNTVFVRNLPFGVSDEQLQEAFADAGPVRKCFLVKDKGAEHGGAVSRGFGFVQFALPEDAQRAVEQMQGALFRGRKLNVELANQRLPLKTRAAARRRDEDTSAAPPPPAAAGRPGKRAAPSSEAAEAAKKRRRAEATSDVPPALSKSSAAAARTVAVGGLAATRKQPGVPLDAALAVARAAGELSSVAFPCPAEHLAALQQDGCPGAVALLEFATPDAAQSAVAALHRHAPAASGGGAAPALWARQLGGEGAQVRRWRLIVRNIAFAATPAALLKLFSSVGFVWEVHVPTQDDGRKRGFAFVAYTCRLHAEAAIARLNGAVVAGRAVAVDWALSKRHYEAHQKPGARDDNDAPAARADAAGADAAAGDAPMDEGALMSHVLASVVQQDAAPAAAEPPAGGGASLRAQRVLNSRAQARRGDEATVSVFAHNLAPESTARDLQRALAQYGRVHACRVVLDKTTGRSKGTAFVEFADDAGAAAALAAAGAAGAGINVDGRRVQLATAVSKEEARVLGAGKSGAGAGVVKDRRNLYLVREGEVLDESPAAVGVSEADMEKRRRAAEEKMAKLRNPNFSISSTRLHIRNLPPSLDDKALRSVFVAAVQARTGKPPVVKLARLLRDSARVDGAGQQRSRGMGFVEFAAHADALAALRAVNNNPTIFGKERRPIVEFALEDARAARKHDLNLKLRARLKSAPVDAPPADTPQRRAGGKPASTPKWRAGK